MSLPLSDPNAHNMVRVRLRTPEHLTYEEMFKRIEVGAKLVMFRYIVSVPLLGSYDNDSDVYYVRSNEEAVAIGKKFTRITRWFGWLNPMTGIQQSMNAIQLNKRGGRDMTKDILANLNEEIFDSGYVEIHQVINVMYSPDKVETRALKKALATIRLECGIGALWAGVYSDVGPNDDPFLVVGYRAANKAFDKFERVEAAVRKQFLKHVEILIIDLNDDQDEESEFAKLLMTQGVKIED
ncbi:MAG: hypothetical protein HWD92_00300 [Flavobacteriia bacterium]|nr:hypothetical protein [Flavobacteriia bacterium]